MNISLELLQILDAIEQRGSFAAAAHSLHRVPSAVSQAINKAETQFGFPLYELDGRRNVLTAAGKNLLDGGRSLLDGARNLEQQTRQVASGWEAQLRIAMDSLLPVAGLFSLIEEFHAEGHNTELRLSTEILAGCWDALLDGRADLAIGAPGDMPPGGGLSATLLGSVEFAFAIAPDHRLAQVPEPIPTELIRRERAIAVAGTTRTLAARSNGLLSGQPTLTVPDIQSKIAAQAAGLGVGYLPVSRAEAEVARGTWSSAARPNPGRRSPCTSPGAAATGGRH